MTNLIRQFGTHYIQRAQFGAAMKYERRYASSSIANQQVYDRSHCIALEAGGCIRGGGSASALFGGFGLEASAELCADVAAGACVADRDSSSYFTEANFEATRTYTIGSSPKNFNDWGDEADFQPLPIRYV